MRYIILLLLFSFKVSANPVEQADTITYLTIKIPYSEGILPAQGTYIYKLNKNGALPAPGIEPIKNAKNLTNLQIQAEIQKQVPKNFESKISVTRITISHKELLLKKQTLILGEAKTTGAISIPTSNTLGDLVKLVKTTPFSATNRIILIRDTKSYIYDLTTQEHRSAKVQPGDIIQIPQKRYVGR